MVDLIVSQIIQIVSILICILSLHYSLRIYLQFQSITSVRLIVISISAIIWTSLIYIANLAGLGFLFFTITPEYQILLAELGITFLFTAFAIVSYIQINPIYSKIVRLTGMIAMGCFIILMGFTFSEFLGAHNFLQFSFTGIIWIAKFDPLFVIIILIATIAFGISYRNSSKILDDLPEYLLSKQKFTITETWIFLLTAVFLLNFMYFVIGDEPVLEFIGLFTELSIVILCLIYVYFSYEQPFLQVGFGANPHKLLENDFIGYFIGSSLDNGPSIIDKSGPFFNQSKIDRESLEALNVGIMTMVGINDSFREELAIVPVPKHNKFLTIVISFFIENPNVQDSRVKGNAPSVLGIVVPTFLAFTLKGVNEVRNQINPLFAEINHIEKLSQKKIEDLVSRVLFELIY